MNKVDRNDSDLVVQVPNGTDKRLIPVKNIRVYAQISLNQKHIRCQRQLHPQVRVSIDRVRMSEEKIRILPGDLLALSEHKRYQEQCKKFNRSLWKIPRKFPVLTFAEIESYEEQVRLVFNKATNENKLGTIDIHIDARQIVMFVFDDKTSESQRVAHFKSAWTALGESKEITSIAIPWRMDLFEHQTKETYNARRQIICQWMMAHPGIYCHVYKLVQDDPEFAKSQEEARNWVKPPRKVKKRKIKTDDNKTLKKPRKETS
jgi:hypothetical protein